MTPEPMEAVFCQLIGVIFSKAKDHDPRSADPYSTNIIPCPFRPLSFHPMAMPLNWLSFLVTIEGIKPAIPPTAKAIIFIFE
jgi:hypothetical protein